ncbi:MAG: putative signal transduction protein [Proteobacteria bacterium]|nr:putative signal transduction protein [Pseudomonadota bacterium]
MLKFLRTLLTKSIPSTAEADPFERLNEVAPLRNEEMTVADDRSFVCREPILNRDERIAGYEFLLHQRLQGRLQGKDPALRRAYDDALIRNLSLAEVGSLLGHRLAFIGISSLSFDNPQLPMLPSANTVLMIDPLDDCGSEGLPDKLRMAKDKGFQVGYRHRPEVPDEAILPWCDFIQISTPTYNGLEIADWIRHLRKQERATPVSLIAADIESSDDLHVCYRAGFDYFHGPFVVRRELWHPPRGTVDRSHIMEVLSLLRSGGENTAVAESIRHDPVITYKLLRYINSPVNSLSTKITSIEQCLLILGRERFYRWLSLLLFDVQKAGYIERMLTEQALIRARLMERLGLRAGKAEVDPDLLFLAGLFSLLDKLLDRPMAEILAGVSMPQAVCAALLHSRGALAKFLRLAIACEDGVPEEIAAAAAACRLEVGDVNQDSLAALVWATEISQLND